MDDELSAAPDAHEVPSSDLTDAPGRVLRVHGAAGEWCVKTVEGGAVGARRRICTPCPYAKDSPRQFPSEVFIASAHVSYDLDETGFGCHDTDDPTQHLICAGFLKVAADHNLVVRMSDLPRPDDIDTGGRPMFTSYREMAIANGVPPDHPALDPCRDNHSLVGTPHGAIPASPDLAREEPA